MYGELAHLHDTIYLNQGKDYAAEARRIHEPGLFTHEEYMESFHANNLDVFYDESGLDGRGLYLGKKAF